MSTWVTPLTRIGKRAADIQLALDQFKIAWRGNAHPEGGEYFEQPVFMLLDAERQALRDQLVRINQIIGGEADNAHH